MANEQLYSDPKLYDDGSGRGAVINQSISSPQNAMANQKTLRPGGAAYVQLPGGPGKVVKNADASESIEDDEDDNEELQAKTSVDYLESLFDGENLTEEFMMKAATIFEAAIHEKVTIIEAAILEASKEVIEEQVEAQTEFLTEKLDNYLNYVITEWMEDNSVAVERGLRTEIAEHFMIGIKELLEETFIDVPDEKYDVLDEMAQANEDLQNQLNDQIRKNVELMNENTARQCAESFMEISGGLTDTEVEKLATLAEGIEFQNVNQYTEKVKLLRESYFTRSSSNRINSNRIASQQNLVEETTNPNSMRDAANPEMSALVNAMARFGKNIPKQQVNAKENSNAGRLLNMLNTNIVSDQYI